MAKALYGLESDVFAKEVIMKNSLISIFKNTRLYIKKKTDSLPSTHSPNGLSLNHETWHVEVPLVVGVGEHQEGIFRKSIPDMEKQHSYHDPTCSVSGFFSVFIAQKGKREAAEKRESLKISAS